MTFAATLSIWACHQAPTEDVLEQSLDSAPAVSSFVLYAERSIRLGGHDYASGNVGIPIGAATSFGPQLVFADHVSADDLYAASVQLGDHSSVRDVGTNTLQQMGNDSIHSVAPFPVAGMPSLPLTSTSPAGTNDVLVTNHSVLPPGSYGALDDEGVLTLSSGTYSFTNINVGAHATLRTMGTTRIVVNGRLVVCDHAGVSAGSSAGALRLDLLGDDSASGAVVAIGSYSVLNALISAPHGTITFADHVSATGAFAASDITSDGHSSFSLSDGFPPVSAGETGSQQLSGYFAIQPDGSYPIVGPVPSTAVISLSIGLPVRDPIGLKIFIDAVSDPTKPNYRAYLTVDQFNTTYGATEADYQALTQWAQSAGFTITRTFGDRLLLSVKADAAHIEAAIHANLIFRQGDGVEHLPFVAVDREPSVNFAPKILWISGFSDYKPPRAQQCTEQSFATGEKTGPDLMANDLRTAYIGLNSNCSPLDGAGQVVGIFTLADFADSDIAGYVAANVATNTGWPIGTEALTQQVTRVHVNDPQDDASRDETAADIEAVLAMAPKAEVVVFIGQANGSVFNGNYYGQSDDIYAAMANDSRITVATSSWVVKDTANSRQSLSELAARGVSFFSASGDNGNIGDPQASVDMPYQTLVGGTILTVGDAANLGTTDNQSWTYCNRVGPNDPGCYWVSEQTWNQGCPGLDLPEDFGDQDITSGGVLDGENYLGQCHCYLLFDCCNNGVEIPSYQDPDLMAAAGGSRQWRNYPDVSANAYQAAAFLDGGLVTIAAGTSFAAPLWAGYAALANQLAAQRHIPPIGFANPVLYAIGGTRGKSAGQDLYATSFHDVADGVINSNNPPLIAGYTSVAGYDLTTGWGTPTCQLLQQLGTSSPTVSQNFDVVVVHVASGTDGVDDDSSVKLFLRDLSGATMTSFTLKSSGESGWGQGTEHDFSFSLIDADPPLGALTPLDIGGVRIELSGSDDDWDMSGIQVMLASSSVVERPGSSTYACVTDLSGNASCDPQQPGCSGGQLSDGSSGVTRISSADNGGPTTASFDLGLCANDPNCKQSGCTLWGGSTPVAAFDTLNFVFDTSDDDLNSDSALLAEIFTSSDCSGTPIQSRRIVGGIRLADQTQWLVQFPLQPTLTYQDIGCTKLTLSAGSINGEDEWHLGAVEIYGVQSSADWQRTCLFYGAETAPSGCGSIFNDQPCSEFTFDTNGGPISHTLTTGFQCR